MVLLRQKESSAHQRCCAFLVSEGERQTGLEATVKQVFYIQTEKVNVFPYQSSHVCDYICSREIQSQASFAELRLYSCSVYNGERQLLKNLASCI